MATRKRASRNGTPINVWLDSALVRAVEKKMKQDRRSKTQIVSIALEVYLQDCGLWTMANQLKN